MNAIRRAALAVACCFLLLCGCGTRDGVVGTGSGSEPEAPSSVGEVAFPSSSTPSSLPEEAEPSSAVEVMAELFQQEEVTAQAAPEPQAMPEPVGESQPEREPAPEPEPEPEPVEPEGEGLHPEVVARITGSSWNESCPVALSELRYLTIPYLDFDGAEQVGEMLVHQSLAGEVEEIFAELYQAGFPIAGMRLVDDYGADDGRSMEGNNSYCFCSRLILGTNRFSVHSYGSAIDINPVQNPYCVGENVYPAEAEAYLDRGDVRPGMIVEGDACYNAFVSRGWSWGGDWAKPDYQHFEKAVA